MTTSAPTTAPAPEHAPAPAPAPEPAPPRAAAPATVPIAIIGALEKEVALIREQLEDARTCRAGGLDVVAGSYRGIPVVATVAGMGIVNAAAATQLLISCFGAKAVLFSGIAGGLNPVLHIGDVVIGERLRYSEADAPLIAESTPYLEEFASDPALADCAEAALIASGARDAALDPARPGTRDTARRYLRGTIATGDRYITGAEMRARVVAATQADCTEMEGAAVAHVAAKNGVPCLVLRAISDNCDEAYDALSERQFDLTQYARSASALILDVVERFAGAHQAPPAGRTP